MPKGNNRSREEFSAVIVPSAMHFKLIKPEQMRKTHVGEIMWKHIESKCKSENPHSRKLKKELANNLHCAAPSCPLDTHFARAYTSARHPIMKGNFPKDGKTIRRLTRVGAGWSSSRSNANAAAAAHSQSPNEPRQGRSGHFC